MSFKNRTVLIQQAQEFDAIVVGSGISGGIAAKELCERGMNTLLIERGKDLQHGSGYITEHKAPWDFEHRGRVSPQVAAAAYPVQSRHSTFREATRHFFIKDIEQPYIEEKPYSWIRADIVGGRSVIWGRQSYRMSPLDFEANALDGEGTDLAHSIRRPGPLV